MKIKNKTCFGLFEVMDSLSKMLSTDKEVIQIRENQKQLSERGFRLYFSPIRMELYYGGFVSENTDEVILCMDYSLTSYAQTGSVDSVASAYDRFQPLLPRLQ